jgi:4-diphosphocytidyl-2-C-methyl-D-erythritol kinase
MLAFSKINLFLEVLGKRPDGYHDIRSVMQSLDLHDILTLQAETPAHDKPFLQVTCSDPTLPTDQRNLVYRAAEYLIGTDNIKQCIHIHIEKRIPVAAGLGGGSSDCAATLVALSNHFGKKRTTEELQKIGLLFGADVPFCITGGTMLAEGVGEILTELTPHPPVWIVLACLPIQISTAEIFQKFQPTTIQPTIQTTTIQPTKPKPNETRKEIIKAFTDGTFFQCKENYKNDLTPITASLHPEIPLLINKMKELGAKIAAMSGSGPSVFGYFSDEPTAQAAKDTLNKTIKNVYITRPERMRFI